MCRVGSLLLPLCDKRVDVLSKKDWYFWRFLFSEQFLCAEHLSLYQVNTSINEISGVVSTLVLKSWSYFHYQIVWAVHLVNDPLSSLLHLPLFEAEETVLQVWPLINTFGQGKIQNSEKQKNEKIRYFSFTWTGAACWARAGDVWRGRGRVLLARGLNKDAAFILFIFLSETILK